MIVLFLCSVDDLREGKGAEYVDASSVTLIFCSAGYVRVSDQARERKRQEGRPIEDTG